MSSDSQPEKQIQLSDMSPAHQAFVLAILRYSNPTRAYMEAYPDCPYDSAAPSAARLLMDVNIRAVLDAELGQRAMQAREVIDKQGVLARGNISDVIEMVEEPVLDRHGGPLVRAGSVLMRQVPHLKPGALETYGYTIKSIRPANGGGVAVEMYSVQDALSAMERIRRIISDSPVMVSVDQVVIYMPDYGRDAQIAPADRSQRRACP